MKKFIYETNYDKMVRLGINKFLYGKEQYIKVENEPYMALHIDKIRMEGNNHIISIAHNGEQNGDNMADPDMELRILPDVKMVEALTYQNDFMHVYQQVYSEDGKQFNPKLKISMNNFLGTWLNNLLKQGFKIN